MYSRVLIFFSLVCFFAGNTFGVRASDKTVVMDGVSSSVSSSVSASGVSPAAKDSTIFDRIKTLVVNGSRVPLLLGQSARMVTVLDSVAIASFHPKSVNDILKYVLGVDVRQRGVAGMQTDISVRGGTFDQIAILLNGINISDPQTGHNAAEFPVRPEDIERIEILEGPSSRVYGTSSLVGAINVVTRQESTSNLSGSVSGGSYGTFDGGARLNLVKGNMRNSLSFWAARSDGYSRTSGGKLNSDYQALKAFWQGGVSSDKADVSWQAGTSVKNYGSNTFYSAKYDDQFEHVFKLYTAIQAESKGTLHLKPQLYWNQTQDRFELFRGAPEKYPFNYHRTNVLGLNLGSWIDWKLGKTAFGGEMRNEDIISTNLGESLSKKRGEHYVKGLNRTNISFYLEHDLVTERFTASAGIIAVENTGNEEGFGFYPGADLSYKFARSLKAYASWNTSYRMPTFTELYYSVGGHQADKNLKAEKMQSLEFGLKYLRSGIKAMTNIYWHHGTDMIDWIKETAASDWTSVNHTEVNTIGEEVLFEVSLPTLLLNNDFPLRMLSVGYSHIDQDKDLEKGMESRYAMEYLHHKFIARAGFKIAGRLDADFSWRWLDREGSYEKYVSKAATGEIVGYKPYSVLDAKLSWNGKAYTIFLEADNLLDKTYYDLGNIPQPGFWFRLGATFRIGL